MFLAIIALYKFACLLTDAVRHCVVGGTPRFRGRRADIRSMSGDVRRRLGPAVGSSDRAGSSAVGVFQHDVQQGVEQVRATAGGQGRLASPASAPNSQVSLL